ncbi:MAG: hypothetical protein ACRELB_07320, partial [Polyangiaceae bacterium]
MKNVAARLGVLAGVVALSGAVIGCAADATPEPWEITSDTGEGGSGPGTGGGDAGTSSGDHDSGAASGDSGSGSSADAAGGQDAASGADAGSGGQDSGTKDAGSADTGSGVDSGTVTSADGFSASRTACINKINALRATDTAVSLKPYTLQNTDTTNTCVDTQASTDQSKNSAHYSFINNAPSCTWGQPSGYAQNECEQGYGTSVAGIEQCLQDMWDESLKPNCAGCIGCTTFGGACSN